MKRSSSLLLLFAVSVGAGAWLVLSPAPPDAPPVTGEAGSCEQSSSCDAIPDAEQAASPVTDDARPAPAATSAPGAATLPAPAPEIGPDGVRLREEADRLIAEGRVLEGIDRMRKAAEADPSARNHGDLGSILERLTAFDEAVVHLRQAAELDPANADRWIALANAHYRRVDPGEAWKAERRAREAEPGLVLTTDPQGRRVRAGDSPAGKP